MHKEERRIRVLLIDGNPAITRFLIINLEHHGFEAPVVHSVEKAEEAAAGTKVDIVALASPELADSKEDVARLRKAFGCPILIYGPGVSSGDGEHGDSCLARFHEPEDFIKAVKETIAKRTKGGDLSRIPR